jgi:hypothetical protein
LPSPEHVKSEVQSCELSSSDVPGNPSQTYNPIVGSPICPLHPNIEGKLDDIFGIVKNIELNIAKEEGQKEAEEKIQSENKEMKKEKKRDKYLLIGYLAGIFTPIIVWIITRLLDIYTSL